MMEATLDALLADLSPRQRSGEYVLVVADKAKPVGDDAVWASVVEPEGRSLVLARRDAERAGLSYGFVAGWITLEVPSALDAVGLTAEVAAALGEAGISCNVLAGYHHDHLLVPRVASGMTAATRCHGLVTSGSAISNSVAVTFTWLVLLRRV